jgi:hypothetical protein
MNEHLLEEVRLTDLLAKSGLFELVELESNMITGYRPDVVAISKEHRLIIFEIKQSGMIAQDVVQRLMAVREIGKSQFPDSKITIVLITSGELTPEAKKLSQRFSIVVRPLGSITDPVAFLNEIDKPIKESKFPPEVDQMLNVLQNVPTGKRYSMQYELACGDILSYLFHPPLGEPWYQASDGSGANRRDFIFPNSVQTGFWADVRNYYRGHAIVFDMKNSGVNIQKQSVLQIAHYLTPHGCGMFGILITPRGIGSHGMATIRDEWIATSRMILCLNNADLATMVRSKLRGDSPEKLIERKLIKFRATEV